MTETTRTGVEKKIEGDLGHATETLSALWEIATEGGDTTNKVDDAQTPLKVSPAVSHLQWSHG